MFELGLPILPIQKRVRLSRVTDSEKTNRLISPLVSEVGKLFVYTETPWSLLP